MPQVFSRRKALLSGIAAGIYLPFHQVSGQNPESRNKPGGNTAPGPTPVRLAIHIKREKVESPEDMIRRCRDAGYTAVKGARHPGGNVGEPWNSMTEAERGEVVKACKKYDMLIYEVGGYTNLITPDDAKRKQNLAGLSHCLEVAESINCPMVGTVAGTRDTKSLIGMHPENWTPATWKLLIQSLKQVLSDTSGMKAVLGMEAQVTTIIDTPRAHRRLMDDLGDPRLKVNLDPVNMISLPQYYHTTELINECFDILGEDIIACHAKDTQVIPDQQTLHITEVCPGRGVYDFRTCLIRLSRMQYPRAYETEHIPEEEYLEAKVYLEKTAAEVGVKMYRG
jgi:sugar phosphate isomerase/epimerase